MKFKDYLDYELNTKKSMELRDVIKMCYQASFGAEHLLEDLDGARRYFNEEFDKVEPRDVPVYEYISEDVARVDLGAWKASKMPKEWLFDLFVMATKETYGGEAKMLDNLAEVVKMMPEMEGLIEEYKAGGIRPVHHSQSYREAHKPAYRLVDRKHLRLVPILVAASKLDGGVIVIDGPCASGKSTMATQLAAILKGPIVRIDDFFLPMELRTEDRLAEAGGNVHYERFKGEVLPGLASGEAFCYTKFDCSKMDYGARVEVPKSAWRIVEGSYSHHPYFGEYGDIRAFSMIDPIEQMRRILVRNGEEMAVRFKNVWIPMENRYFEEYNISKRAHLNV